MSGHSSKHYIKIWAILCALLLVSIIGPEVAKHTPPTAAKYIILVTAFGIAGVKAYLVARHFMHVNVEPKIISMLLFISLGLVLLFFIGTAPDVMRHDGTNWNNAAAKTEIERALKAEAEGGDHHGTATHDDGHGDAAAEAAHGEEAAAEAAHGEEAAAEAAHGEEAAAAEGEEAAAEGEEAAAEGEEAAAEGEEAATETQGEAQQ